MSIFGMSLQTFAAAQTMGQQINAKIADEKAQTQQRLQSVEMGKMDMAQKQQQLQAQQQSSEAMSKIISQYDSEAAAKRVDGGLSPDMAAEDKFTQEEKMYRQMAKVAATPAEREAYLKLSDSAETKLMDARKANTIVIEKKVKDIASYAGTVIDGDATPAEAFDWVKQNVGLKAALEMPTKDGEFQRYWRQKQSQGLTAAEQIGNKNKMIIDKEVRDNQAKAYELNKGRFGLESQRLAIAREEAQDKAFTRAKERADKAPKTIDIAGKKYEFDPNMDSKGERLGTDSRYALLGDSKAAGATNSDKIAQRQVTGAINAANELARGIQLMGEFGATQTSGVFSHMKDGTDVLSSLSATGGNKATTQEQQMYSTTMKGFGLEFAQLMTVSYGRGATKPIIEEFNKMVEGRPGDTQATLMFKMANAADVIKTRLEGAPDSTDPKLQKVREAALAKLNKLPSPSAVLAASRSKGAIDQATTKHAVSLGESLDKLKGKEGTGNPEAPAASPSAGVSSPTTVSTKGMAAAPGKMQVPSSGQRKLDQQGLTELKQELANAKSPWETAELQREISKMEHRIGLINRFK